MIGKLYEMRVEKQGDGDEVFEQVIIQMRAFYLTEYNGSQHVQS